MKKIGLLKSIAAAAMTAALFGGMLTLQTDVKAANYSSNKGKVTIAEDGTVTVDFTLSEVDKTQVLYGFGICLFEEKPELLSNDKLVNSGKIFYDSEDCKHAYHKELDTPISEGTYADTFTITYEPDTRDIDGFDNNAVPTLRDGGVSLVDALKTKKDWYIVVGVHTTFGGEWHTNCDLYLGQVSEVTGGEYFIPHEHNWNYDVEDNKIYAWCDEPKLECGNYGTGKGDAKLIDVLTAEDVVYTGEPYDKASATDNIKDVTGATRTAIEYFKADESGKTTGGIKIDNPPVNAGNYYVTITIIDNNKEYTAVKSFDIDPLDITPGTCNTEIGNPNDIPDTVTVTIDNIERTLTVGTDCIVEVGDKTVTVIGKGNYTGTITLDRKIEEEETLTTGSDNIETTETETYLSGNDDEEDDADASVITTGEVSETGSPVTGYNSYIIVLATLLLLAMTGMSVSFYAIKKN